MCSAKERQTGGRPPPDVVLERQTGGRPPPHVVLERQTGGLPPPDVVLVVVTLSPEAFSGPSNIQFVGQTSDSLRFRWSPAGGPVSGYVVQYTPLSGLGQPITADLRQVGSLGMPLGGNALVSRWRACGRCMRGEVSSVEENKDQAKYEHVRMSEGRVLISSE